MDFETLHLVPRIYKLFRSLFLVRSKGGLVMHPGGEIDLATIMLFFHKHKSLTRVFSAES